MGDFKYFTGQCPLFKIYEGHLSVTAKSEDGDKCLMTNVLESLKTLALKIIYINVIIVSVLVLSMFLTSYH
jgi:hypothetical protein